MNIGIFTDTYHPQINGVVTSILMLEKELEKLGHNVFVFTTTNPDATYQKANVFRFPSMPLTFLPSHRIAILYSPKLLLKMKSLHLDIIHTHTEFSLGVFGKIMSGIHHIPMVHTYHTMYENYTHYIFNGFLITPKMAQHFSRVFCNRAEVVIAPVDKTLQYLKKIGVSRIIETIPTGLDFAPFKAKNFGQQDLDNARLELGIEESDPVIVYIGRVAKEKSLDVLIAMMPKLLKRIPKAKLVVVGDGPIMKELKKMAVSLSVHGSIIFAGARPWDSIVKYYRVGNVFATASTSETQGLTYIEAMASCIPVVVKKDPSFNGIIKHGETGFIFEKDQDAADMIHYALTHRKESLKIAEQALKSVQALSSHQYALDVEKVYYSLKMK